MNFNFLILCTFFVLTYGDVINDIRTEEEKRHNLTLTKYVRAAFGGALQSIFPSVTDAEANETDKILAQVLPIGDPSYPFPDSEEKIESKLCLNHRERGVKIMAYARKRWPTHLIMHITVRIGLHSVGEKNDEYCRNTANRLIYTTNATLLNSRITELNLARNNYIDRHLVIVYGNTTLHKLAMFCCSIWNLRTEFVNSAPTQQSKQFIGDYMDGYNGQALKYLCVYHSQGSKACASLVIPQPPNNVTRFTSVLQASFASLSKITTISA